MGMIPFSEAPIAAPTMHDSASGVSMQRSSPNSATKPSVARKTPPSPTSSPMTMTRSSRFISSNMASRMASTIVFSVILGPLFFHEDVPQSRRRFGLWLLLYLIGGSVYVLVHAIVDLLLGVVIENTQLLELQRKRHDWVLCRPSLYFFTGAITAVIIVAGMRHQAVGFRFDKRRPFAGPRPLDSFGHRAVDGEHVVSVDGDPRKTVTLRANRDVLYSRLLSPINGDRIVVVFANEDHRQPVHSREVHRLVPIACARRAITEVGDSYLVQFSQLRGKRRPHCVRDLCGYRGTAADDSEVRVAEVRRHVPAPAADVIAAGEEAPQDLDRRHPDRHGDRDIAVVWEHPVDAGPEREGGAHLRGLVTLAAERHRTLAHALENPLADA